MDLFELFKLSRTLRMKDGTILLMDTPVNIIPTDILCDLQKDLIDSVGVSQAYKLFYESAKNGAIDYNKEFIKIHRFKDKRDIVEWQWKIVTLAGWGKWSVTSISNENILTARFENSPFPRIYGNSNFPVDFIPAGFSAGGISAAFNKNLEALETKCMAMGDPFCEIVVGPPEFIEEKKQTLWHKWKLI